MGVVGRRKKSSNLCVGLESWDKGLEKAWNWADILLRAWPPKVESMGGRDAMDSLGSWGNVGKGHH